MLEKHQNYYFRVVTLKFSCFYIQPQLLEHIPFFTSQIKTPTRIILMLVRWLKPCERTFLLLCCHNIFENKTAGFSLKVSSLSKVQPTPTPHSSDPLPNLSWRWPWPIYRDLKFWLHPALFCFSRLGTGGHTLKEFVTGGDLKAL